MSEYSGKVIVITGAAGNLGTAVAQAFSSQGAELALLDLNEDGLIRCKDSLDSKQAVRIYPTNLINPESVAHSINLIQEDMGHVDVLCNIAGGFTMGPMLHETSDKDWDFMMNLNARSMFNCCRAVVPLMQQQSTGRIVSVSARAATIGKARMGPYCASKAAVITLTESLAAEQKFNNINVNCILPGTIDTPQNRADMPDADFSNWVPASALADVVLFLASDAARCVTGAAIPVYGKS